MGSQGLKGLQPLASPARIKAGPGEGRVLPAGSSEGPWLAPLPAPHLLPDGHRALCEPHPLLQGLRGPWASLWGLALAPDAWQWRKKESLQ